MPWIHHNRQARESAHPALGARVAFLSLAIPSLAVLSLAFCLASPLLLRAAQVRGANEDFPVVHDDSITIRILDGVDGHPVAHARVSLLAGYDQRDLHLEMWHQEVSTDDHGRAKLSKAMANLPLLQISVARTSACEAHAGSATFSVDLIRRDGVTTPNRCGTATSEDAPGLFTVFVKTKPSKSADSRQPATAPAVASPTLAAPASTAPAPVPPSPTAPAATPAPAAPAPSAPAPKASSGLV